MSRPKDLNSPSPWNMRIWDCKKHQWLCDGEDDVLPYYGFDIRGGEVTAMQSMDWVYRQFEHGRKLIWEQSTGLIDKNGIEIYEGDIVEIRNKNHKNECNTGVVRFRKGAFGCPFLLGKYQFGQVEVIGNVHENGDLIGGEE